MFAIRVIASAALPPSVPQTLDYFWPSPLPRGSLVRIPVGRRILSGIVLESSEVTRQKLNIKRSGFSLRKLESVLTDYSVATEGQLMLIQWLATHYASGAGSALRAVLPPFVLTRSFTCDLTGTPSKAASTSPTPHLITADPSGVIQHLTSQLKKTSRQVFIMFPEQSLARQFCERFSAHNPLFISSALSIKQLKTAYRAVADGSARVVIGTRAGLFLPWRNLRKVLVEDPHHDAYKADRSPRLNAPDVARVLATWHGAELFFLAPVAGATHRYLADRKSIRIKHKPSPWPAVQLHSVNQEREQGNLGFFARAIQERLLQAYTDRIPILLYSSRRAYGTTAVCARCKAPARCPDCDLPYRFWKTGRDAMLVCYRCAASADIPKTCSVCHGGILKPAGLAGSQKIADAFNHLLDRHGLSTQNIPILDSDLVRTPEQEADILKAYTSLKHPVLVATQMIFRHRYTHQFPLIVLPTADGLMTSADYRTRERFLWHIEKLAAFQPQQLHLQVWETGSPYTEVAGRNWDVLFNDELAERKQFGWPPFRRIVRLSYRHSDAHVAQRQASIALDRLQRASAHLRLQKRCELLGPLPTIASTPHQRWEQALIVKHTLTNEELGRLLSYLPGKWTIDVDPRSIA